MMIRKQFALTVVKVAATAMAAIAIMASSACANLGKAIESGSTVDSEVSRTIKAIAYTLPECTCCSDYLSYLEGAGFQITATYATLDDSVKERYPAPQEMRSCHIILIDGYFIEGHVPIEAIRKLLKEKPDIDGVILPGMPSGSPGMPGEQIEPFVVFGLSNGQPSEFMTIP